ncbi:MAG: ketopantoate reductase family protein [Candidatus Binataceae bacterium]
MKILIMGAGTIGLYYGARLRQAGEDVVFCARGNNLRMIQARGVEVKSISGDFSLPVVTATSEPGNFAPYDLILFCVKSYHTEEAARQIAGFLKSGAAVMTIQNGVENESALQRILGDNAVMSGNARIFADMTGPARIVHTGMGYIDFGELNGEITARARSYGEAFQRAGILGELVTNIWDRRWEKLMSNNALNSVTTITGRNLGALYDDQDSLSLIRSLMAETISVARAEGAKISEERIDWLLNYVNRNLRDSNSSTLQDLKRGRRLEYDAICGAVIRAARRHGIAVPITEAIYILLKMLDPAESVEMRGQLT